jgi:hypothetical protein
MKKTKSKRYECPECGAQYEDIEDAEDCCPRIAEVIEGFECGECGEFYEDEEEAADCCKA